MLHFSLLYWRSIITNFPRPLQRLRCPPRARYFTTEKKPYHPEEVDRACGVPQTAPEAGPRNVWGIMGPELWYTRNPLYNFSTFPVLYYANNICRKAPSFWRAFGILCLFIFGTRFGHEHWRCDAGTYQTQATVGRSSAIIYIDYLLFA